MTDVMVVDDDAGMRESLVDVLVLRGLTAVGVATGADAVSRQADLRPTVAVVDHRLPDMTGLDLCGALREADPSVQLVLLTGYATLEDAIAAVGQADEFLTKPVHPDELVRIIRGAVERATLRRENADLIRRLQQANTSLEGSISERTNDLAGLAAMAEAIARAQDLEEVLAAVVRTVARGTAATEVSAYLLEEPTGALRLRATWPDRRSPPATLPAAARSSDRVDVLPDRSDVVRLQLIVGGDWLGLLNLQRPRRVNPSFLHTLAIEAAVAIQNAQRFARERETVERLSEVSRLKSAFLGSVSHELRTPLTAVVGFAQTLGAYGDRLPPEDRRHMLERIVVQGERLRRLIGNLLDSTALETGTLRVSASEVDVGEVIKRVADAVDGDGPSLVVDIPDDLPPVWADEGRVEQILGNLIDNATKHTPASGRVKVTASSSAGFVELRVADEGPGVEPSFLPRLFEAFTQADSGDNRRQSGVGLGLFIARGLVDAMGGSIGVSSSPAGGACFRVQLPRTP